MNNSFKTPIAVTKEQREKFRRRFKKNMPRTLSGIIFHAAGALEKFIKRDNTTVAMETWHRVRISKEKGPVCMACLAGSAMIDLCGATGFEVERGYRGRSNIGFFNTSKITATMTEYKILVDQVRKGKFKSAHYELHMILTRDGGGCYDGNPDILFMLEAFGDSFRKACDKRIRNFPKYIDCLRHSAGEVQSLGL